MNRTDRIHVSLTWCETKGIIRGYVCQSDSPGLRWTLEGIGFHTRVYSTAEVEAFILGATEGRTTGILDAPSAVDPATLGIDVTQSGWLTEYLQRTIA